LTKTLLKIHFEKRKENGKLSEDWGAWIGNPEKIDSKTKKLLTGRAAGRIQI